MSECPVHGRCTCGAAAAPVNPAIYIVNNYAPLSSLGAPTVAAPIAPTVSAQEQQQQQQRRAATEGLTNALRNLNREYESNVINDVLAALRNGGSMAAAAQRVAEQMAPPSNADAQNGEPPAPAARGNAVPNSIVFNSNGVGFLVNPYQLTAMWSPDIEAMELLDEFGNVGAGAPPTGAFGGSGLKLVCILYLLTWYLGVEQLGAGPRRAARVESERRGCATAARGGGCRYE